MGPDFNMTTAFTITTDTVAVVISQQDSMDDLAHEITQQVADVTASVGANNSLILENTTGDMILIGAGGNEIGFTEGQYEGMVALTNVDGSAVKIELGNERNGYVAESTATGTNAGLFGLNESSGAGITKGFAVSSDTLSVGVNAWILHIFLKSFTA